MKQLYPPMENRLKHLTPTSRSTYDSIRRKIWRRSKTGSAFVTSKDLHKIVQNNSLSLQSSYAKAEDIKPYVNVSRALMSNFPYFPLGLTPIIGSKSLPTKIKDALDASKYNTKRRCKNNRKVLNGVNDGRNSHGDGTVFFSKEWSKEIYTEDFLRALFVKGVFRSTLLHMTKFEKDTLEELLF